MRTVLFPIADHCQPYRGATALESQPGTWTLNHAQRVLSVMAWFQEFVLAADFFRR